MFPLTTSFAQQHCGIMGIDAVWVKKGEL